MRFSARRMRRGAAMLACGWSALFASPSAATADEIVVGSKSFTEGVVVGELATGALRAAGFDAEHRRELGGTRILFRALLEGDLDVYGEYTGTLALELLRDDDVSTPERLASALARRGLAATPPLGFNNTYALGMRREVAARLGISRVSDLRDHADLRFGFTNEFMDRGDGWPGLRRRYSLPQTQVRGLDHDIAYRALLAGDLDVVDLYSTDAEIVAYDLAVLDDDAGYFPRYEAVLLHRADLATRHPGAVAALARLGGTLDEARMQALNARVRLDGESEQAVASSFLVETLDADLVVATSSRFSRILGRTKEHLFLVGLSMIAAILVAVPLGVVAARRPRLGQLVLGLVGVVQTIPALALLVFMIPLLGIYAPPALAALFLYSLLPIVRNTHTGLVGIAPPLRESALALGLSPRARLRRIELPLAAPQILGGIKTATVLNIGFATLGALIGAGGYGQPILTGIRLDDLGLILEGAVPAAVLALLAQGLFEVAERRWIPPGLRGRG